MLAVTFRCHSWARHWRNTPWLLRILRPQHCDSPNSSRTRILLPRSFHSRSCTSFVDELQCVSILGRININTRRTQQNCHAQTIVFILRLFETDKLEATEPNDRSNSNIIFQYIVGSILSYFHRNYWWRFIFFYLIVLPDRMVSIFYLKFLSYRPKNPSEKNSDMT